MPIHCQRVWSCLGWALCVFLQLSIGCVRARFAKHIAILILVDACASAGGYYLFGYAFAFGDSSDATDGFTTQNRFIGSHYFALSGLPHSNYYLWVFQWSVSWAFLEARAACSPLLLLDASLPPSVYQNYHMKTLLPMPLWYVKKECQMFQSGLYLSQFRCILLIRRLPLQFAATACTIVSGAIAERTKFETYILYSFFMSAWVYPVLTHSIWFYCRVGRHVQVESRACHSAHAQKQLLPFLGYI